MSGRSNRIIICTCCERRRRHAGYGYCATCYSRWRRAGRPDGGPPPPQPLGIKGHENLAHAQAAIRMRSEQTLADYAALHKAGVSDEGIAARMGVSFRTVERYRDRFAARQAESSPGTGTVSSIADGFTSQLGAVHGANAAELQKVGVRCLNRARDAADLTLLLHALGVIPDPDVDPHDYDRHKPRRPLWESTLTAGDVALWLGRTLREARTDGVLDGAA